MKTKKVLVVDDESDFRDLIKARLEENDYEVTTASDGMQALERLKVEKPDAVLLDILMPGLDGLTVLKRIRRFDKDLPVFILTASSDKERFVLADKLNASGFLVKTGNLKWEINNVTSVLRLSGKYRAKANKKK